MGPGMNLPDGAARAGMNVVLKGGGQFLLPMPSTSKTRLPAKKETLVNTGRVFNAVSRFFRHATGAGAMNRNAPEAAWALELDILPKCVKPRHVAAENRQSFAGGVP